MASCQLLHASALEYVEGYISITVFSRWCGSLSPRAITNHLPLLRVVPSITYTNKKGFQDISALGSLSNNSNAIFLCSREILQIADQVLS